MLKNFIGTVSWKFKWVLALGFLASSGAFAASIPSSNPQPVPFTGSWNLGGGPDGDLVIIPQGEWIKNLAGATGTTQGDSATLTENLILESGTLSSWTETILGGNWVWDDGNLFVGGIFGGNFTGIISNGGATISFGGFFADPAQLEDPDDSTSAQGPLEITITKHLSCVGATEDCPTPFSVVENAAPEPGTLLLLAGGLAGLAGLRRRRYS